MQSLRPMVSLLVALSLSGCGSGAGLTEPSGFDRLDSARLGLPTPVSPSTNASSPTWPSDALTTGQQADAYGVAPSSPAGQVPPARSGLPHFTSTKRLKNTISLRDAAMIAEDTKSGGFDRASVHAQVNLGGFDMLAQTVSVGPHTFAVVRPKSWGTVFSGSATRDESLDRIMSGIRDLTGCATPSGAFFDANSQIIIPIACG